MNEVGIVTVELEGDEESALEFETGALTNIGSSLALSSENMKEAASD